MICCVPDTFKYLLDLAELQGYKAKPFQVAGHHIDIVSGTHIPSQGKMLKSTTVDAQ